MMRTLLLYAAAALLAKADDPWGLDHADAYDVLDVPFDASREQCALVVVGALGLKES